MNHFIKPNPLKLGDKVAIVAPAGVVESDYINKSIEVFEGWGLKVELGKHLFAGHNQFAGTDEQRLSDFQNAIDDEEVKAVICARGGYGTMRIIDKINWNAFVNTPKWVAGFSDITTIHFSIQNLGIQSIHSVMPINLGGLDAGSGPVSMLKDVLFGNEIGYELSEHKLNFKGTEIAPLVGGNLSILYGLKDSAFSVGLENRILFLEDVGEQYYHIDRMIQSLRLAGVFEKISGLLVGGLTEMEDKRRFGMNPEEIIAESLNGFDIPVAFGFPAGHQKDNRPLVLGGSVAIEVKDGITEIRFL